MNVSIDYDEKVPSPVIPGVYKASDKRCVLVLQLHNVIGYVQITFFRNGEVEANMFDAPNFSGLDLLQPGCQAEINISND